MKLKTYIVEDHPREYEEIKVILKQFDFIEIIGRYLGEKPFDDALNFIQAIKPDLLILDFDLGQGSTKTGKELFKLVNNYQCFVIFYSRLPEATNAQSANINAKFIRKELDPLVSIEDLTQALQLAKQYLVKDKTIKLKFYAGKEIRLEEYYSKNLVEVYGSGKKYYFKYFDGTWIIEKCGPASKGVGVIIDEIIALGNPDLHITCESPLTLINKSYFNQEARCNKYLLKDSYRFQKKG